jgi:hypothetical protein
VPPESNILLTTRPLNGVQKDLFNWFIQTSVGDIPYHPEDLSIS